MQKQIVCVCHLNEHIKKLCGKSNWFMYSIRSVCSTKTLQCTCASLVLHKELKILFIAPSVYVLFFFSVYLFLCDSWSNSLHSTYPIGQLFIMPKVSVVSFNRNVREKRPNPWAFKCNWFKPAFALSHTFYFTFLGSNPKYHIEIVNKTVHCE